MKLLARILALFLIMPVVELFLLIQLEEVGVVQREDVLDEEEIERLQPRFRLGMFDPPELVDYAQIPYEVVDSPEHRELARRVTRESIVLLKNEGLLPLEKDMDRIAVIGPNADQWLMLLGNYNGVPGTLTTPLEGIRQAVAPGTDDPSGGTRPAGTGGPGLAIVGTDDAPDLAVRPSVGIVEDTATAEHPPQVRVTVTNESDRTVRVGEGRAIVFAYVHDESRELVWLPVGSDYPAEPDCWRLQEPIAVTQEYRVETLEPGASVEQVVGLYGSASGETDACLPVGEFRFTTTYSVTGDDEAPDEGERAEWGFSVSLE